MKKTVKLLATLLTLVLALGMFACAVSAAGETEAVVLSGETSVNPGDTYAVEVIAKSGLSYTNVEFTVTYDKNVFTIADGDIAVGPAMCEISAVNNADGAIKFASASAAVKTLSADTVLATLTFKVKEGLAADGDVTGVEIKVATAKLNDSGAKVFADGVADDALSITVKHTHNYETKNDEESVAPECDVPGYDRYYCACGEYKDEPIAEKGHDYVNEWTAVEGEENWFENKCNDCDTSVKTYDPADVENETYGATVSVGKGVFTEQVTPVIDAPTAEELADVKALFDSTVSSYYVFKVDFLNDDGASVAPAAGTTYDLSLNILDIVADLDYDVAMYDAAEGKLVKLSDKVDGNELTIALKSGAVLAVYGGTAPVAPDSGDPAPDGGTDDRPSSTGDNSVLPIAIVVAVVAVLIAGAALIFKKKKS